MVKMNKRIDNVYIQNALRVLVAFFFSIVTSLSLLWIGEKCSTLKPWLSLIVDVPPDWYMNTYYTSFEHSDTTTYKDAFLLSLDENVTRKDIADVLNLVAQYSPKVIGVDYTFPLSENYDSANTAYLINTINNLPEQIPIVFAYDTAPSAIPDSVIKKHHWGHVKFPGYYNFKAYDNGIPHMALAMAELAGYDSKKMDTSSFVVNYNSLDQFGRVNINRPLIKKDTASIAEGVQNKIVLIGSTSDPNDILKLPFKLKNEEYIAGSIIVNTTLLSILSTDATEDSPLNSSLYHCFYKLPTWENWCIVLLFALIYLILYCLLDNVLSHLKNQNKRKKTLIINKSVLSLLFIAFLMFIMMRILTARLRVIPNVVLLLYMAVFMSCFYELLKKEL